MSRPSREHEKRARATLQARLLLAKHVTCSQSRGCKRLKHNPLYAESTKSLCHDGHAKRTCPESKASPSPERTRDTIRNPRDLPREPPNEHPKRVEAMQATSQTQAEMKLLRKQRIRVHRISGRRTKHGGATHRWKRQSHATNVHITNETTTATSTYEKAVTTDM